MEADFVVVGAGSAGCVLANRLSASGKFSVVVIEHGGSDIGPFIQMPAALSYPMNMQTYDWGYISQPEPNLNGRRLVVPRGKVIGGSSSINGMVYVRGHAQDFDGWRDGGATGWGYSDVLPYFLRMENWHGTSDGDDAAWRGGAGPLHITRGERKNPLYQAFETAGRQAGYGATPDYNGYRQEGFGALEQTVWKGRRWSAANAYLRPALKRQNVRLQRGKAHMVVISDGRATGVEIDTKRGRQVISARCEVILAAGSINSPLLLMRSGIGAGAHLADRNIKVVADRPGVGENLQDHLEVYLQMASTQPVTLYKHWNIVSKALIGTQWLFTKTGLGASNQFESGAFIRSGKGVSYPDIQLHFLPMAVRYDGRAPTEGHGFQIHAGPMRSKSRGRVRMGAQGAPDILFNYMSCDQDWTEFRKVIRLVREVFAQPAFAPFAGHEIQPGKHVQDDAALDAFIRDHAESAFHPCGTCKMGAVDDPTAVVDPHCNVIGVRALRVADSSIFPAITNGNLNGPSIMVGEKASDHILGRGMLRADTRNPWINPDWQHSQK